MVQGKLQRFGNAIIDDWADNDFDGTTDAPAGALAFAYARDVRRAMDVIGSASLRLTAQPGGGALSLAILPTFGTRWLAPRLPDFLSAHPGVTINLGTRLRPFDFAEEGFDAAIHFGEATWPEAGFARLFDEKMVACAAPGFMASHPVAGPRDLVGLPLLQLETRPAAWSDWFAHHGVAEAVPLGMLFDQFAAMIQAAIYGMGVALLPEFLAKTELATLINESMENLIRRFPTQYLWGYNRYKVPHDAPPLPGDTTP